MRIRPAPALAATVAVLAVVGCSTSTGPTPVPTPVPRALTMLHIDGGTMLDPAVDWFVEAVAERSDGALTVEVETSCCGEEIDVEERLVGRVAGGDGDLGWVGTRVFAELGADGLRALTAPFAITDYAHMEQVIASDEAGEALASLEDIGVEGLAVVPGLLRYPLAAEAPIQRVDDWSGVTVASFHSEQQADALRALGAEPLDVGFAERDQGIFDGEIKVLENSLVLQDDGREETLPHATIDVPLWGRVSAIIAPPDRLSDDEAAIIRAAAADVVARTPELAEAEEAAMRSACGEGARYSLAGPDEVEAMRARTQPVWEALESDGEAAPLLRVITELQPDSVEPPSVPEGCDTAAAGSPPPAAGSEDPAVLNGSYRTVDFTREQLVAEGFSASDVADVEGTVFTLTFTDGAFELVADQDGQIFGCEGDYSVTGDEVVVRYRPGGDCGPGGTFFEATFVVDASTLTFTTIDAGAPIDEYLFGGAPLTRVN